MNQNKSWNEIQAYADKPLYSISIIAQNKADQVHVNVWTKDDFINSEFDLIKQLSIGESKLMSIDGRDAIVSCIAQ